MKRKSQRTAVLLCAEVWAFGRTILLMAKISQEKCRQFLLLI
jgi:hypothetical protein